MARLQFSAIEMQFIVAEMHLKCSLHENLKYEIHGGTISMVEGTFFGFFFSMEKIVKKVGFL
jgi:hypothetical protein